MRAQVTAEFLVVLSALMTIFLIFYVVYSGQNLDAAQGRDSLLTMRDAYSLSNAINAVYLAGDGASYNATIAYSGPDENLSVSPLYVEAARGEAVAQSPLISGAINSTAINGSQAVITNSGGAIGIAQQ